MMVNAAMAQQRLRAFQNNAEDLILHSVAFVMVWKVITLTVKQPIVC